MYQDSEAAVRAQLWWWEEPQVNDPVVKRQLNLLMINIFSVKVLSAHGSISQRWKDPKRSLYKYFIGSRGAHESSLILNISKLYQPNPAWISWKSSFCSFWCLFFRWCYLNLTRCLQPVCIKGGKKRDFHSSQQNVLVGSSFVFICCSGPRSCRTLPLPKTSPRLFQARHLCDTTYNKLLQSAVKVWKCCWLSHRKAGGSKTRA